MIRTPFFSDEPIKTSPQELEVNHSKTVRNQTVTSLSLFSYSNPFRVAMKGLFLLFLFFLFFLIGSAQWFQMTFFDLLGNSAFKHTTFLAIFKIKTKNFHFLRMCVYIFSFRNVCYNCKYSACIKTALFWEQHFLRSFPFLQGIG